MDAIDGVAVAIATPSQTRFAPYKSHPSHHVATRADYLVLPGRSISANATMSYVHLLCPSMADEPVFDSGDENTKAKG